MARDAAGGLAGGDLAHAEAPPPRASSQVALLAGTPYQADATIEANKKAGTIERFQTEVMPAVRKKYS